MATSKSATAKTATATKNTKTTSFVVESLGKIKTKTVKNVPNSSLVVYNRYSPQKGATAYTAPAVVTQKIKDAARGLFAKENGISSTDTNVCTAGHYRSKVWAK